MYLQTKFVFSSSKQRIWNLKLNDDVGRDVWRKIFVMSECAYFVAGAKYADEDPQFWEIAGAPHAFRCIYVKERSSTVRCVLVHCTTTTD